MSADKGTPREVIGQMGHSHNLSWPSQGRRRPGLSDELVSLKARVIELEAQLAECVEALERQTVVLRFIAETAESFHKGEDGKARALNVIAERARDALSRGLRK
jgi:hypothetical protein